MPGAFSITNGKSTLIFEPDGEWFVPKLYLERSGQLVMAMSAPSFLTLWAEDIVAPARIIKVLGQEQLEFEGEFPGLPDWHLTGSVVPAGDQAPRFDWQIRVAYIGDNAQECRLRVRFEVCDAGVPRWMVPAMFYKHNRPENCVRKYPRYSYEENRPEDFISSYWAFRSDRSSCPSVFCWTDNFTTCLATSEMFSHGQSGIGFVGTQGEIALMLNFPYAEEPVKYSSCREDGNAPEVLTIPIMPAERVSFGFSTYVDERDLHAYNGLIRDIYNESEDETSPWLTKLEAEELLAYGLYRWHYDAEQSVLYETCAFDSYFGKGKSQVDRPHMHVAWVSGAPYAYVLWRYGQDKGIKEYAEAGLSVLDKIANEGISPCGLFWPEWTQERGWGTGWNPNPNWIQARTVSEATWFFLQALEDAKEAHENWASAVRSNLDVALRVQRADGNFGSYYNVKTGEVEEWDGAGGLMWIPALLAGSRYFGNDAYADAGIRAGEYYSKFVEDEYIYGAPEDVHLTPTSEDGYNALIAYLHLYETTRDNRWLELAKRAADWVATFRWVYNTVFSQETILGRYNFRTMGGDIASPSNNHIHNYGLICHPEMLRLWSYTGDTYYLSRAADHLACFHQFIAREDGDFNARKGMITEQWFHTDWTHPKGSMLQLAHCWCAGLVLYADMYTRSFGDVVIDSESREVYVLDNIWLKETEEVDNDIVLTLENPSLRDQTLSVRHSRIGVVGKITIPAQDELRVRIDGRRGDIKELEPEEKIW